MLIYTIGYIPLIYHKVYKGNISIFFMVEKYLGEGIEGMFKKFSFAISNPARVKIYKLCLSKKLNITTLSEKIDQSYKSILNNLRILEEAGMIARVKEVTKIGQETLIESLPVKEGTIYSEILKEVLKEK